MTWHTTSLAPLPTNQPPPGAIMHPTPCVHAVRALSHSNFGEERGTGGEMGDQREGERRVTEGGGEREGWGRGGDSCVR
jgi:hypothetical protein